MNKFLNSQPEQHDKNGAWYVAAYIEADGTISPDKSYPDYDDLNIVRLLEMNPAKQDFLDHRLRVPYPH